MERKKKTSVTFWRFCVMIIVGLWGGAVSAAEAPQWPIILRSQIARLTNVGYRLGLAASSSCPSTAAGIGISIDYLESYDSKDRAGVARLLAMTDAPQIAAVASGSPADKAGIKPGDDIVAIDGTDVADLRSVSHDTSLFADELEHRLAATPKDVRVRIRLRRDGNTFEVDIIPRPICAARFIIKTGLGITAFSDGSNIAISSQLIGFAKNDDELALIAGHELGHVISRDGKAGSLAERRGMEDRADLLGVRLSHCAGYDPELGVDFWLRRDAGDWLRLFRDPTHRSRKSRVALMRKELSIVSCPVSAAVAFAPSESDAMARRRHSLRLTARLTTAYQQLP